MSTQTPIALITGGSRGLGRNTALKLAEKGSDVIITYHSNRKEADAVVALISTASRPSASTTWSTMPVSAFTPALPRPPRRSSTSS
jgi:NAD(P)-dependent dehydrogenase (short-subunit alcohol dehydrogenase family)